MRDVPVSNVISETVILRALVVIFPSLTKTPGYLTLSHAHFIPFDHQLIIQHTEASEESSKYEGMLILDVFHCLSNAVLLPAPLSMSTSPKRVLAREDVLINTSTRLNRTCRLLEVNIGKCCGGGKVQFNSDMKETLTMGHLSVVIVQSSYHMLLYNMNYREPRQIKDAVKPSTFRRSHLAHNG